MSTIKTVEKVTDDLFPRSSHLNRRALEELLLGFVESGADVQLFLQQPIGPIGPGPVSIAKEMEIWRPAVPPTPAIPGDGGMYGAIPGLPETRIGLARAYVIMTPAMLGQREVRVPFMFTIESVLAIAGEMIDEDGKPIVRRPPPGRSGLLVPR